MTLVATPIYANSRLDSDSFRAPALPYQICRKASCFQGGDLSDRYDEAVVELRRAPEPDPNFVSGHHRLSVTSLEKGMYAEASPELEKTWSFQEERMYVRQKIFLEARKGKRSEARKALEQSLLSKGKDISSGAVALVYAAPDDKDRTFFWLNQACAAKASFVTTLKFWSVFDSIRSDRRFVDLLRRVGLERD